jgi:copper chaperone CopZ
MQEEGVAKVIGDLEKGTVVVIPEIDTQRTVIPKMDIAQVNLFDFVQRVNGTRNFTVLKMDVVATGYVTKFLAEYYTGGMYSYSGDRYKLQAGGTDFILSKNEKLDELINSGYKIARVEGTVSAFSERVPIMQIREFEKPVGMEEAELAKSLPEAIPDHISSVGIHVDGFICATCVRTLESALGVEEGVGEVTADLETGIVTVTPKMHGQQVNLVDLMRRVNSTRNYAVGRMDIVAVGRVAKFPVRYFKAREYTHSHDRYKLQVGDKYFILSENDKLDKLIKSGHERVKLMGTVSAFSERVPIILIQDFVEPGGELKSAPYANALDTIAESFVKERETMKEKEHAHIDSVRVYVDGFICAACDGPLQTNVQMEEGVEIVHTDAELGLIEIIPKEGETFELHDVWQRINTLREYKVIKMDVVASGEVIEVEVKYGEDTLYPETNKRYKLSAGKFSDFVLSENEKLKAMLKSGDRIFTVVGTVTAFRGLTPILNIRDYKKLEERPEWLEL